MVSLLSPNSPNNPNSSRPGRDCALCPRLRDFRLENRRCHPDWHNAPVPSFGELSAPLTIVGLAPGLGGANRTGRPFTGDGAGDLLFPALIALRLADGMYARDGKDDLTLVGCRIVNVLRCVPPQNLPTREEILNCRRFFQAEIEASRARVFLALGQVAHRAMLDLFGLRPYTRFPFRHGGEHLLAGGEHLLAGGEHRLAGGEHRLASDKILIDSYHCSRRNTSRGLLTKAMFTRVLQRAQRLAQQVQE